MSNPFQLTIPDTSPLILYTPSKDVPPASGWNTSFSGTPFSSYSASTIPSGQSAHTTLLKGAKATLVFNGLRASVLGDAYGNAYSVLCDGAVGGAAGGGGVLGGCEFGERGNHNITLSVDDEKQITLNAIQISTLPSGITNTTKLTSTNTTILALSSDGTINPFFDTSIGKWEPAALIGGGSSQIQYNRLATNTPSSLLSFDLPTNTSLFYVFGSTNNEHGLCQSAVRLQGTPGQPNWANWRVYDQSSAWLVLDSMLAFGAVDPTQQWEVWINPVGITNSSQFWDLSKVVVTKVQVDNGGSSKLGTGAIVGIAIGAVAVIAFLILGFLFWRRKKQHRKQPNITPIDLHDGHYDHENTIISPLERPNGHQMSMVDGAGGYASLPTADDDHRPEAPARQSYLSQTPLLDRKGALSPTTPQSPYTALPMLPRSPGSASSATSPGFPTSPSISEHHPTQEAHQSLIVPPTPGSAGGKGSRAATPRTPPAGSEYRQEVDAGRVVPVAVEVVPPEYDESWAGSGSGHGGAGR